MAVLLPVPFQYFPNPVTGLPLSFGKMFTYAAGTNTPKATYSDQLGTIPLTNPINFDAEGFPLSSVGGTRVNIWVDGSYKYVLQDANGVQVGLPVDNVSSFVPGGANTIDINGMTLNNAPAFDDTIPTYDTSAAANRKVALQDVYNLFAPLVLQRVHANFSNFATGTALIPNDNTIPQITEGTEFMSLSITPKSTTSILVVEANSMFSISAAQVLTSALFQDAGANALAAMGGTSNANNYSPMFLRHIKTSGSTTPTTFRLRAGLGGAGTVSFNGYVGVATYGGVSASSMMITEYAS